MSQERSGGGLGLAGVLFVVFLTLKLCSVIDWNWAWVTAPLWIPIALVLAIIVAMLTAYGTTKLLTATIDLFLGRHKRR